MNKKIIRTYSVLTVAILFAIVVGFGLTVKAQSEDSSVLDKVIEILKISNSQDTQKEASAGISNQEGVYVVTKKIDYDDITTTGADLTNTVIGDFVIENIILETGSNTIASGTQIQISTSGDAYGTSTTLFATDVAAFPKATTMDLNTAIGSVVGGYSGYASSTQRVVLEDGSKLIVKCTTADCKLSELESGGTGGYLRATAILRKADTYSQAYE